jgi:hypothetical protein
MRVFYAVLMATTRSHCPDGNAYPDRSSHAAIAALWRGTQCEICATIQRHDCAVAPLERRSTHSHQNDGNEEMSF